MSGSPLSAWAARFGGWVVAGLLGVLLVVLIGAAGLAAPDAVTLGVLLVAMPALALAQAPLLARADIDRLPAYWSSIVTLGILGALAWAVGTRVDGLEAIGVRWLPPLPLALWTAALTAAGLGIILAFRSLAKALRIADSRVVHALMPRTARERGVFALLSVAAGVGEEAAYRGYAIPVLTGVVGTGGAVAVTSAVFGVLHVYQGPLGVVRTAMMGAVLAWGFLQSGSLLPAIAAHTLIDLLAGIVLADKLLVPPTPDGVVADPPPAPQAPA